MRIERHVFASNASRYETAWATFGASRGVDGALATRLEEQVPWGRELARLADPPRLSGDPREVVSPRNVDRLGQSFLHVEPGLWAWSIHGGFGGADDGAEPRVLTHTLLLDAAAFRALAGHPAAALGAPDAPADWVVDLATARRFDGFETLEPVELPDRELCRARRTVDLRRWAETARSAPGVDSDALARALAALWERLAGALAGGPTDRGSGVAVPVDRGGPGAALLRVAWHALPAGDRLRVPWIAEHERVAPARVPLFGVPTDAPSAVGLPDPATEDGAREPGAGRRHWAETFVRSPDAFERLERRAAARGFSLVLRDDLAASGERAGWLDRWLRDGPSVGGAAALAELEARRPAGGRWRAVGEVFGEAIAHGGPDALGETVRAVGGLEGSAARAVVHGAVRELRRRADTVPLAGRLRALASDRPGPEAAPLRSDLRRLVDRESDATAGLLREAPAEVFLAALRVAAADGDRVALELARLAAPRLRWRRGGGDAGAALVTTAALGERLPGARAGAVLPRILQALAAPDGTAAASPAEAGATERLAEALAAVEPLLGRDGVARTVQVLTEVDRGGSAWRGVWAAVARHFEPGSLAAPDVLPAVVHGLRAGHAPFGADPDPVAGELARRLVEGGGLDRPEGPARALLLRLLWAEGTGATVARWRLPARVPLLAALLTAPAPPPLDRALRGALEPAARAARPGALEEWRPAIEAVAPATWEAIARPEPGPLWLGGRAGGSA